MELINRPRRLRTKPLLRELVSETRLNKTDLLLPLFLVEGHKIKQEIGALPGVYHLSLDYFLRELEEIMQLGIPGVLLFGIPDHKDELGSGAYREDGLIQRALRQARQAFPELLLAADVCLCEYTSHGHCGVVENGRVDNDRSVDLIVQTALSYAAAGADIIAPSDMMDGRIGAIRRVLEERGFTETVIMAYSAKYASAFYGPFREAARSAPAYGDRKSYQLDFANRRAGLREVELDVAEGADIIMVKPALAYLDIIKEVSEQIKLPVAAYNVSGEYAMIKAAARQGWLDEKQAALETLTAIRRAGAKIIITYFAKQVAEWLA